MKIVIIEDEQYTADDLENCIKEVRPHFQIVKRLSSVKESISYFEKAKDYDLLFSDIQLGDGLSFEIFKSTTILSPVIFCTAYDNYAIEAFKANGIDYILKPISKASIKIAIEKYERLVKPLSEVNEEIQKLLRSFTATAPEKPLSSLLVHYKDKIIPVKMEDIAVFYTHHEVCRLLSFDGKEYTVNETLEKMESRAGSSFFRANRQYLVNRRAVLELVQHFSRKHLLKLSVILEEPIIISKEKTPALLKWLEEV